MRSEKLFWEAKPERTSLSVKGGENLSFGPSGYCLNVCVSTLKAGGIFKRTHNIYTTQWIFVYGR